MAQNNSKLNINSLTENTQPSVLKNEIGKNLNFVQFAIDHAADAAFWVDVITHKFIYVNHKATQYLGYNQDELLHLGISDIDVRFTNSSWVPFVAKLKTASEMTFESDLVDKHGTVFPVEITAKYMEYEGKSYVIAFIREIISRRKAEKELLEAKENAEKASKAKSEFLTSMSHELKTPLNAIIGYSEMLYVDSSTDLSEEQLHFSKSINQAGHHLLGLIDNVLDLATIESGKATVDLETVDIRESIEHCVSITSLMALKKGVTVNISDINCETRHVVADKTKLAQVILNIVSNAIKYNKKNGRVDIGFCSDKDKVMVNIRDTGYGISEALKKALFSPFNRLGQENSDIEGTGVGLVICKSLIELMGGSISFESVENEGSCFQISIPIEAH